MTPRRCPFCGSCEGPRFTAIGASHAVECRNCGATGALAETESDALAAWNKRPNRRAENARRVIRDFIRENLK